MTCSGQRRATAAITSTAPRAPARTVSPMTQAPGGITVHTAQGTWTVDRLYVHPDCTYVYATSPQATAVVTTATFTADGLAPPNTSHALVGALATPANVHQLLREEISRNGQRQPDVPARRKALAHLRLLEQVYAFTAHEQRVVALAVVGTHSERCLTPDDLAAAVIAATTRAERE